MKKLIGLGVVLGALSAQQAAAFTVVNKTENPVSFTVLYAKNDHTEFDTSSEKATQDLKINKQQINEPMVFLLPGQSKLTVSNLKKRFGYDRDLVYSFGTDGLVRHVYGNVSQNNVFYKNLGSFPSSYYTFFQDENGNLAVKTSTFKPSGTFSEVENPFDYSLAIAEVMAQPVLRPEAQQPSQQIPALEQAEEVEEEYMPEIVEPAAWPEVQPEVLVPAELPMPQSSIPTAPTIQPISKKPELPVERPIVLEQPVKSSIPAAPPIQPISKVPTAPPLPTIVPTGISTVQEESPKQLSGQATKQIERIKQEQADLLEVTYTKQQAKDALVRSGVEVTAADLASLDKYGDRVPRSVVQYLSEEISDREEDEGEL